MQFLFYGISLEIYAQIHVYIDPCARGSTLLWIFGIKYDKMAIAKNGQNKGDNYFMISFEKILMVSFEITYDR